MEGTFFSQTPVVVVVVAFARGPMGGWRCRGLRPPNAPESRVSIGGAPMGVHADGDLKIMILQYVALAQNRPPRHLLG